MGETSAGIDELLINALPARPVHIVCIGTHLTVIERDVRRIAGEDASVRVMPLEGVLTGQLSIPDGSLNAVVLHEALRLLDEDQLALLLAECYRVLGDGGRIVVRERTVPYSRLAAPLRKLLRRFGVAYTPSEIFTFLERAGFWECLVLRRKSTSADVVIKGEKVVLKAKLDHSDPPNSAPVITVVR
jgi:SAM-dependent methyltransferase